MVKKVEECSQHTKEDSADPKDATRRVNGDSGSRVQRRANFEMSSKAMRRKKVRFLLATLIQVPS